MGRYDDGEAYGHSNMSRQKDLVLSINEFCFLQNKTDGTIKSYVGPLTTPISQQEALVIFNERTKKFEDTVDIEKAKQLFCSAPEGWYAILKNPTQDGQFPMAGKPNMAPNNVKIGTKVNIPGPVSFALYPGQMAKVVQGHRLRSNQYLLARVYDADAAKNSSKEATIVDADGNAVETKSQDYFVGQLLVIKGTDVSFYMPPTGIEVIPIENGKGYVRDAVTLERLEYAILKDEDGEKRYVHGPAVVFPKPTETFTLASNGGAIFRALELSPISGIYVKVIAAYDDEIEVENEKGEKNKKIIHHPVGEELFITGNDQMIYYPRPEHALIQYDGKYMHHAIAIPEGEGRYVLNRLTGEIKTVKGYCMYLADPRTEVIVKRKLSLKECELFYPGNKEVIAHNEALNEKRMEKLARKGIAENDVINNAYSTADATDALKIFEATSNISRGVSYTKPRTITLDTKYDGVVSVDVWTGYAINVVSKTGKREVVLGPTTRLLDYDETLEALELSTGKPKTTDYLMRTAYLRVENNKISDIINVQTKDFVDVQIKVSYCVDFLQEYKDKWFSVENYVKFLCDRMRSLVKREVKKYTIQEFYASSTDIVRKIVLNIGTEKKGNKVGRMFTENGMLVHDVEVLSVAVERGVANILEAHQEEMIRKNLELTDSEARMKIITALAEVEKKELELKNKNKLYELELEKKATEEQMKNENAIALMKREEEAAKKQAIADLQPVLDSIQTAEMARQKSIDDARIASMKAEAEIEKAKQEAYANTVKSIMESISEDLVAALTTSSNEAMLETVTKSMSPYAIANNESVSDVTNRLLRGTTLEGILDKIDTAADKIKCEVSEN